MIRSYIVAPRKKVDGTEDPGSSRFAAWKLRGGIRTLSHVKECMDWAARSESAELLDKLRLMLARESEQRWCLLSELDEHDKDLLPQWTWMQWTRFVPSVNDSDAETRRILIGKRDLLSCKNVFFKKRNTNEFRAKKKFRQREGFYHHDMFCRSAVGERPVNQLRA